MPGGSRSTADEAFLMALACGATVENAARAAGISRSTAQRRLQAPEMQARLQQIRSDIVQRTSGTLTAASMEAVKTLMTLMQPSVPAAVRLGASRVILEMGMRLREAIEMVQRIEAIEARLNAEPGELP
jgi:hypothetical protein